MSDRALRRLVAKLSEAPEEDVEAILAELDLPQRRRVVAMMAELSGAPAAGGAAIASSPDLDGVSPWLAARVRAALPAPAAPAGRRPSADFLLAPAMLEALRGEAEHLPPAPALELTAAMRGPTLVGRMQNGLRGLRRTAA